MIYQKRYQIYAINDIIWTNWFNVSERVYQAKEKWQVKDKLLNEYRVIKK